MAVRAMLSPVSSSFPRPGPLPEAFPLEPGRLERWAAGGRASGTLDGAPAGALPAALRRGAGDPGDGARDDGPGGHVWSSGRGAGFRARAGRRGLGSRAGRGPRVLGPGGRPAARRLPAGGRVRPDARTTAGGPGGGVAHRRHSWSRISSTRRAGPRSSTPSARCGSTRSRLGPAGWRPTHRLAPGYGDGRSPSSPRCWPCPRATRSRCACPSTASSSPSVDHRPVRRVDAVDSRMVGSSRTGGGAGPGCETAYREALETGQILFFPRTPFELPEADQSFLRAQRQVGRGYHKNIAYRPASDRVSGFVRQRPEDEATLRRVLRDYPAGRSTSPPGCCRATRGAGGSTTRVPPPGRGRPAALAPRAERPGPRRRLPDAAVGRRRILRVFTNVNPAALRVSGRPRRLRGVGGALRHLVGAAGPRPECRRVARAPAGAAGPRLPGRGALAVRRVHAALPPLPQGEPGVPGAGGPQDDPQLPARLDLDGLHPHRESRRAPGQYALEQTFIVTRDSLALPEKAPIAILERLAGATLSSPDSNVRPSDPLPPVGGGGVFGEGGRSQMSKGILERLREGIVLGTAVCPPTRRSGATCRRAPSRPSARSRTRTRSSG